MKETTQTLYIYNHLCERYGISEQERWGNMDEAVPKLVDRLRADGHAVSYDTDNLGNIVAINFPKNFRL